jgi:hypothetical protein
MAAGVDVHGAAATGGVGRVAKGVANRVARLKAIGNGQVPQVAAMAWGMMRGARSGEPRAKSEERRSGSGSKKQRAKSRERRAESTKGGVDHG